MSAVEEQTELFDEVTQEAGDQGASLWITEVGWGSASGGNPLNAGAKGQAKRLQAGLPLLRASAQPDEDQDRDLVQLADSATSICDWCASSGLLTTGAKAKPAWAFKRVAR